jgi:phosphoesterase RecJ-like protein
VDEVRAIVLPKLCALFDGDAALSSAPKADVRGASR